MCTILGIPRKNIVELEKVLKRSTEMIEGSEHLPHKAKLKRLGLSFLFRLWSEGHNRGS